MHAAGLESVNSKGKRRSRRLLGPAVVVAAANKEDVTFSRFGDLEAPTGEDVSHVPTRKAITVGVAACFCLEPFAAPSDLHTHKKGPIRPRPGPIAIMQSATGPTDPTGPVFYSAGGVLTRQYLEQFGDVERQSLSLLAQALSGADTPRVTRPAPAGDGVAQADGVG